MKYYSDDNKTVLLHVGRGSECDTKTTANQISQIMNERYKCIGSYTNPDFLVFRKEKSK